MSSTLRASALHFSFPPLSHQQKASVRKRKREIVTDSLINVCSDGLLVGCSALNPPDGSIS
jgi:hypothetical protein